MDDHMSTIGPYVIAHGDVWRKSSRGGRLDHVCSGTEKMAIAHDGQMLLKVGSELSVSAWAREALPKYAAMQKMLGEDAMDDMQLVLMPVSEATIEEINLCIAISGRVSRLMENLERIGEDDPSLFGRPVYPR